MMTPRLVLVGRSRAGLSVAAALRAAGLEWVGTWNRTRFEPTASEAGFVELDHGPVELHVIAVRDEAVGPVAARLAAVDPAPATVVHLSGAAGLAPLEELARGGAATGFVHPIRSFPAADLSGSALRETSCGVSIPPEAAFLREALAVAGARLLEVAPGREACYHGACTVAANLTVALLDLAVEACVEAGVPEDAARPALGDLAARCARAVAVHGAAAALTGPASRGDADVVGAHLRALPEPAREVYRRLTARAVELAVRSGLGSEAAARVHAVLDATK